MFLTITLVSYCQSKNSLLHYWDDYDFENPSVFLEGDDVYRYFCLLKVVSPTISKVSIQQVLGSASKNNQIFSLFIDTYRVYLFNPESFFCDYEKYLAVVEYVIGNDRISQSKKSEFELERTIIYTNRIGNRATDFMVVDRNNIPIELFEIESDYLVVFFHNPNCSLCIETKNGLANSEIIKRMIASGKVKVFAVCPYDDYDSWFAMDYPEVWLSGFDAEGRINQERLYLFPNSSSLYLLDKNKMIIKKDIRLDLLEEYLFNVME